MSVNSVKNKPNILWIFSDQHRAQAMSCAGDPNIKTSNLDKLAAEGIRFTRAYCNSPLCAPFRAGLLTGKHMNNHGVNSLHVPLIRQPMLPETMQQLGYYTSYLGKWHLCGGEAPCSFVAPYFRPGWNDWTGWENSNRFFDTWYTTDEQFIYPIKMDKYQTDGLTDLVIDSIKDYNDDKPWFRIISYEAPHPPTALPQDYVKSYAPKEYLELFSNKELVLRPNVDINDKKINEYVTKLKYYYAAIKNLDDNIGRLIDCLEQTNQLDDTIIFYFSDHGDFMGSHRRLHKQRPEEESSNIPLIIRYPKMINAGVTVSDLISSIDFAPTLMGMLNAITPSYMEGMDLSHLLSGKSGKSRDEILIQFDRSFSKLIPENRYRAIVTQRYKYAHFMEGPALLYDLEIDPYEMNNLSGKPEWLELQNELCSRLLQLLYAAGDSYSEIL